MYQCLGLGTVEDGGCGEDWWHPECLVGLSRDWYKDPESEAVKSKKTAHDTNEAGDAGPDQDEPPDPPGFPSENDFEVFLCYKCVDANPWIKRYAGTQGFLPAVNFKQTSKGARDARGEHDGKTTSHPASPESTESSSRKRKIEPDTDTSWIMVKKPKPDGTDDPSASPAILTCRYQALPPPPSGQLSLFLKEDFRDHFCRCRDCFMKLAKHPQLLEEEDIYEPPLSESEEADGGGGSVGTGSLLDRGEAALSNMDRVRAIGRMRLE